MVKRSLQRLIVLFVILVLFGPTQLVAAQERVADEVSYTPARFGLALLGGAAYDPDHIGLIIIQGQMLLDYEQVAWHKAPDDLKMKFEVNAGLTLDGRDRSLISVNMMALRYLGRYTMANCIPYVEAGIGLIYTDFKVDGQGLNLNFNPQAGVGFEYALSGGGAVTTALRLHHLSNGNTYKENRGVNSALLLIGYLF